MKPLLPQVQLNPSGSGHVERGHPWVFTHNVQSVSGDPEPGALVRVADPNQRLLGFGYYNPKSLIPLRMLYPPQAKEGPDHIPDEPFALSRKLDRALSRRKKLNIHSNAFRLIWSEADGLPGVVCDVYHHYIVIQCLTAGADLRKGMIIHWLVSHLKPRGIYEKSLGLYRSREGLKPAQGWVYLSDQQKDLPAQIEIYENDMRFLVDLEMGQKTGFYLDQRPARRLIRSLKLTGTVLDAFSYTGGFSIAAVKAGAAQVTAVDSSKEALAQLKQNAGLNGCSLQITTVSGNVFNYLTESALANKKYRLVMLDPPSFTRTNKNIDRAILGFIDLHNRAARLLEPHGLLLTCCCSHSVTRNAFKNAVLSGVRKAGRKLNLKSIFGPDPDHPEISQIPETRYLTCLFCQIG